MPIYNLGSINVDHVYQVLAFPAPGETIASSAYHQGLGGKGANQSVAAARAGATVHHIGAIGDGGDWIHGTLSSSGVSTDFVKHSELPTGHAIIMVDARAENTIVLYEGANHDIDANLIETALSGAATGDWFLLQNETNLGIEAARRAKELGLKVAYSAAPFEETAVSGILPFCDLLVLNEIEAAQCASSIPGFADKVARLTMIVTKGADGADCHTSGEVFSVPSIKVTPLDTTGAGDTFLGYVLAELEKGSHLDVAIRLAVAAAALQVTRKGAIDAIPTRAEVDEFLAKK